MIDRFVMYVAKALELLVVHLKRQAAHPRPTEVMASNVV
jgi:hypothetical protein